MSMIMGPLPGKFFFLLACLAHVESFTIFNKSLASRRTKSIPNAKDTLLQELDDPLAFNSASKKRSQLVADLTKSNPVETPGATASFTPLAVGTWRIIYAPHIYTMSSIFQGSFDPVYYIMGPNGEMTSHAKYNFPILGAGWLSVSGTYGSQDENTVCRVDFEKAWVKMLGAHDSGKDADPYDSLEAVPPSPWRDTIQALGRLFFIDAVSVFPVSYLDQDTVIFDFELLGTRICARKVGPVQ